MHKQVVAVAKLNLFQGHQIKQAVFPDAGNAGFNLIDINRVGKFTFQPENNSFR